ncbi:MAG: hypothetical protein ACYTF0_07875, partial [Planctomycetota bacterium]
MPIAAHLTFALITIAVMAGCGGGRNTAQPGPPAWALEPPTAADTLYGIGSAQRGQRQSAIDAARVDLISQIEISIEGLRSDRSASRAHSTGDGSFSATIEMEIEEQIVSQARLDDLPGVRVERTEDTLDKTWALVAFDRHGWAVSLRLQLAEVDRTLAATASAAADISPTDSTNRFASAARIYQQTLPLIVEREYLTRRLRLAAPTIPIAEPPVDIDAIRAQLRAVIGELTVAIDCPI